ncbi:hypothetical protein M1N61_00645 [Peptococcaceae bacterium]|nr:hypothetical protein [Peptococcaceae bacterium]MCL0077570.1 hypothetical protein [Peptococcaceae bacterium]
MFFSPASSVLLLVDAMFKASVMLYVGIRELHPLFIAAVIVLVQRKISSTTAKQRPSDVELMIWLIACGTLRRYNFL